MKLKVKHFLLYLRSLHSSCNTYIKCIPCIRRAHIVTICVGCACMLFMLELGFVYFKYLLVTVMFNVLCECKCTPSLCAVFQLQLHTYNNTASTAFLPLTHSSWPHIPILDDEPVTKVNLDTILYIYKYMYKCPHILTQRKTGGDCSCF